MPVRKIKLNWRERLSADLKLFVQQYGRKAQRGVEPNDRRYSRKLEAKMRRMSPEELDELLRDDPDISNWDSAREGRGTVTV